MTSGHCIRRAISAVAATVPVWATPAALCASERWSPVLAQGVSVSKTSGKSYIVESIVTVALIGLALWTICKSSRRV